MAAVTSSAWSEDELNQPVPVAESPGDLSLPWTFISLASDDQRIRVAYTAGDGSCVTFAGVLVTETQISITLTATGRYTSTPPPSACPAMLVQGVGSVSLDSRVGDRRLIHAGISTNPQFPPPNVTR